MYVVGPGFLLALLSQGQVFCWPYWLRARFFAGPTVAGPGFLLALIHPWRADNFIILMYVVGPGFLLALLTQAQVFCWPNCHRARFFAGPNTQWKPFWKKSFFWPGLCSKKKVAKKLLWSDFTLVWNIFFWPRKKFSSENEKMIACEIPLFPKVGTFFEMSSKRFGLSWVKNHGI